MDLEKRLLQSHDISQTHPDEAQHDISLDDSVVIDFTKFDSDALNTYVTKKTKGTGRCM